MSGRSRAQRHMVDLLAPLQIYRLGQEGLIDAELSAYSAAFEPIEALIDRLYQNAFVQTADEDALRRYEEMVGLPERRDIDDARRRELIIYRLRVSPFNFTALKMLDTVRAAGIEAVIEEDSEHEALHVQAVELIDCTLNMDIAQMRLESLLPAHLHWELDFGLMTWDIFEAFGIDWAIWDALDFTWDAFDTDGQNLFPAQ